MRQDNLLVWLPSPMGDAVLSTPALRAIRKHYASAKITFLCRPSVRDVLSPCDFNDEWIVYRGSNPFKLAGRLRKYRFSTAILFKNSFGSALTVFLAGIESRIGYSRECRAILLTDKLYPAKLPDGKFKPVPMIDYYLAIASRLGAESTSRRLELAVADKDKETLKSKLPDVSQANSPIVILVPGGAFGPSKCWPAEHFARTADWLVENYNAKVVISVAPQEKAIAQRIVKSAQHKLVNLAEKPMTLGELKALFSKAALAVCNDTGPRHIAIAMGCKVITMFGPNEPAWTQTGYENEVQIIGRAPCAPCLRPTCNQSEHLCMNSISVERVCRAADKLLKGQNTAGLSDKKQQFTQLSGTFFIDVDYAEMFSNAGLTSIEAVFAFNKGKELSKKNLADYRSRLRFQIGSPPRTMYLKRYKNPPLTVQIDKWLSSHRFVTCGLFDVKAAKILHAAGISTAKIIAFGEQTNIIFEKKSFLITEKVPNARSLEKKLPDYFEKPLTSENFFCKCRFIEKLAGFIHSFHKTGFCHRDLYLCHIFCDDKERFTLIDLSRAFQPRLFKQKFRVKDLAQLYYSAAARYFSRTDRLRFYKAYSGCPKLTAEDKNFISRITDKADAMARHDRKHGRVVPFRDIK